ncbi:MAG TPA: outer membrane beta-barrel protein [Anditalea sp.]|nr:outer membrane beta-barrel protein [Anditalea sp.]
MLGKKNVNLSTSDAIIDSYMYISTIRVFLILFLLGTAGIGNAQQRGEGQRSPREIRGTVMEGETGQPMIGANVVVKSPADSVLASAITDVNGNFTVVRPRVPSVIVEISFLGFERIRKTLNRGDNLDLGTLKLQEDSKLLDEFVLQGQVPVGEMKGDTTSFNANAFRTRENAVAEDLVRKIPGVTIQNGEIQARGEQVQKVLVDGREFFGNDPFLALRNLPSDVIDRVEILDQRSDQSRLTGFDDGNYARTINIVTRQDKRNGQFGRVYGGYGTDNRYSAGGNINFFKGNKRISVIGLFNNINQQNFSSQDLVGIEGGGGGGRRGPGGGGGRPGGGNNNFAIPQDNGIITTNSLGLNYSDKWGERTNFTASYFFNSTQNHVAQLTNREIILSGDNRQLYQESLLNNNRSNNHRVNSRIEYDINEKNAIIIAPSFTGQTNTSFNDRDAINLTGARDPLSEARTISDSNFDSYNFSNNFTYRYKFDKVGRTISANVFTAYNKRDEFTELITANRDYVRNAYDTLNQETFALSDGFNYRTNITYTEPLSEKAIGTLSYQIGNNKSSADQRTFQLVAEQGIMVLDTALSNQFDNRFITQRAGTGYRYNNKGLNVNLSVDYQNAALDNASIFPVEATFQRSFHNVLPSMNIMYRQENGTSYRIRYRTSTNEPNVQQLQNVVNNANPLQMRTGNPNLGQSYNHTIFANMSKINMEKSRTFFVFLFASMTDNFIGNSTFIAQQDTAISEEVILRRGGQLTSPVNLNGQINSRLFMTYGVPVAPLKSTFNMNSSVSFNRTPGIINEQLNLNDNIGLSQGLTLTSNISKDVDFTLTTTGTYSIVNSSLQTNLNNNFYIQNSTVRMYYSPNNGKLFIANTVNNALYRGLSEGLDQSVWLWNIEAGMRFLKDNKGELKINVFDLLKQNNSITRNVSDVAIDDVFTQVLTRYAMLSFTYIIGNFKPQERQEGGPGQRMRPGGGRTW